MAVQGLATRRRGREWLVRRLAARMLVAMAAAGIQEWVVEITSEDISQGRSLAVMTGGTCECISVVPEDISQRASMPRTAHIVHNVPQGLGHIVSKFKTLGGISKLIRVMGAMAITVANDPHRTGTCKSGLMSAPMRWSLPEWAFISGA